MRDAALLGGVRRALVLAPHTDDELGCAGTVARLLRERVDVHYVALSRCEESVPAGFAHDVLETECRAACEILGIPSANVQVWPFRVRHFPSLRQEILERFVVLNRELQPDLVFAPASSDLHQDHATVALEAFRAFKHATLLGYELPQNNIAFDCRAFVHLTEEDLALKVRAMTTYASQAHRIYATGDFIRGLAHVRGAQANTPIAEAFEIVRLLLR